MAGATYYQLEEHQMQDPVQFFITLAMPARVWVCSEEGRNNCGAPPPTHTHARARAPPPPAACPPANPQLMSRVHGV